MKVLKMKELYEAFGVSCRDYPDLDFENRRGRDLNRMDAEYFVKEVVVKLLKNHLSQVSNAVILSQGVKAELIAIFSDKDSCLVARRAAKREVRKVINWLKGNDFEYSFLESRKHIAIQLIEPKESKEDWVLEAKIDGYYFGI